jgi:hypothetical protein
MGADDYNLHGPYTVRARTRRRPNETRATFPRWPLTSEAQRPRGATRIAFYAKFVTLYVNDPL